jgi:hypothetical protein
MLVVGSMIESGIFIKFRYGAPIGLGRMADRDVGALTE